MVDTEDAETALFPERVGDRLRAARIRAGMDLSDIATKTRVPLRHLQAIEGGDYSSFPSTTYCVGFVKAYARAIGADEVALANDLRVELGDVRPERRVDAFQAEDADPARVPGRMLAWTAAIVALLIAGGYALWRSQWFAGDVPVVQANDVPTVPAADDDALATGNIGAAPVPAVDPVVTLTARAPVWVRIYDAADKVLFEKEMAAGEQYVVPVDAQAPKIRTGRAELLAVTLGDRPVAPLGPPERTIKDVEISARALAARDTAPAPGSAGVEALPSAPVAPVPALPAAQP